MKQRLDLTLVERGLVETRARAQALIMAGEVLVDGRRVDKAGAQVDESAAVEVKAALPYVSRGGLKLVHALDVFGLRGRVAGKTALDIGSSTGGFTDVLLQAGAAHVYAVDVGTNQLAWRLRTDPRVTVMEQTNIREVQALPEDERRKTKDAPNPQSAGSSAAPNSGNPQLADLATADVSFIGLEMVTPAAVRLTTPDAFMIFLIKPQFEAGREQVGKGGVVRDPRIHRDVIMRLAEAWRGMGLHLAGLARSPITGPAGNVEYLAHIEKQKYSPFDLEEAIKKEVVLHGK
jgi:23S rRNA (cytidine1920-2'-O)/16S rRNA (cytidine1409-2'-O)-methyltransferase